MINLPITLSITLEVDCPGQIAVFRRYWMIGAENSAFETFEAAAWSQFQMVIGEFPFNEKEV